MNQKMSVNFKMVDLIINRLFDFYEKYSIDFSVQQNEQISADAVNVLADIADIIIARKDCAYIYKEDNHKQ